MDELKNSNLIIEKFAFNIFEVNTYIIYDDESKEAWIIDPGNSNEFENDEIERFIRDNNLKLTKVLNTHGHIDHVYGVSFIKTHFDVKYYFPSPDLQFLKNIEVQAELIGVPVPKVVEPDFDLHNFETLQLGSHQVKIIKTPGHSPGGTSFVLNNLNKIIVGDLIFYESIGRTDLWGGDYNTLIDSIKEKIFSYPEESELLPGHGRFTTIRHEKLNNPFLNN